MNNYVKREKRTINPTKLIALLLIILLVATGLAACKKKAPQETQVPEEPQATEETEEAEEEAPDEPQETEKTEEAEEAEPEEELLDEAGYYYTKDEVALYIHTYGHLPDNYMTKKEAKKLGWSGGSLENYAPDMVIGGDRYGNYEGNLPDGKNYTECDIDTHRKKKRGAKRIVFSDDGYVYYTEDHYDSFELLYEPKS